eukprot:m.30286 g.30286  ORF g.30286 m.30286 type:complete len:298 (-) comp13851_c0_seq1:1700-2593(-)
MQRGLCFPPAIQSVLEDSPTVFVQQWSINVGALSRRVLNATRAAEECPDCAERCDATTSKGERPSDSRSNSAVADGCTDSAPKTPHVVLEDYTSHVIGSDRDNACVMLLLHVVYSVYRTCVCVGPPSRRSRTATAVAFVDLDSGAADTHDAARFVHGLHCCTTHSLQRAQPPGAAGPCWACNCVLRCGIRVRRAGAGAVGDASVLANELRVYFATASIGAGTRRARECARRACRPHNGAVGNTRGRQGTIRSVTATAVPRPQHLSDALHVVGNDTILQGKILPYMIDPTRTRVLVYK